MITIRLYPPSLNPVKDDAPGWHAARTRGSQSVVTALVLTKHSIS